MKFFDRGKLILCVSAAFFFVAPAHALIGNCYEILEIEEFFKANPSASNLEALKQQLRDPLEYFGIENNSNPVFLSCVLKSGRIIDPKDDEKFLSFLENKNAASSHKYVSFLNKDLTEAWDESRSTHVLVDSEGVRWIPESYRYYENDLVINNVIASNVFNFLLPESFPRIRFLLSKNEGGEIFLSGTVSQDMNFISVSKHDHSYMRRFNEPDIEFKKRCENLDVLWNKLHGVEELYAIVRYLGLSTPRDEDVGLSMDTGHAMMIHAADYTFSTFRDLNEEEEISQSCFISRPFSVEYTCNKTKILNMLEKISSLKDEDIDGLIDNPLKELSKFYGDFQIAGYQESRTYLKSLLKNNRKSASQFLGNENK